MAHDNNINIYIGPLKGDLPDPVYLLPVTPEIVSITDSSNLNRSRVIGIGEIAQVGSHNLRRFTISSFFPKFYDTFTSEHLLLSNEKLGFTLEERLRLYDPEPLVWVNRFKAMRDIPLKIVISGINVDENYIMNNFTWSAVGGQGSDIEYTATFVQYKELSIRMIDFVGGGAPIQINYVPIYIPGEAIYVVVAGDTWASISQKTGVSVTVIMALNGIHNAWYLRIGLILHLRPFVPSDLPEITPPIVRPGI